MIYTLLVHLTQAIADTFEETIYFRPVLCPVILLYCGASVTITNSSYV